MVRWEECDEEEGEERGIVGFVKYDGFFSFEQLRSLQCSTIE
jgi:hypothetical protein